MITLKRGNIACFRVAPDQMALAPDGLYLYSSKIVRVAYLRFLGPVDVVCL